MRKIYLILIALSLVVAVTAQKANVDIKMGTISDIDAFADEAIWDAIDPTYLEKNFGTEEPTVTAWFKACYDEDNFYLFFSVEDDEHLPSWMSGEANHWEWDKPEVYFDVNEVLNDGLGAKNAGDGHHQYAPPFEEANYDTPVQGGDMGGVVTWCYTLVGEGYDVEYSFPISALTNKDGVVLTAADLQALPEKMGFDLTAIDRETGDAARKRKVWQSDGTVNEAWGNMDGAGTLTLLNENVLNVNNVRAASLNVYPNPVKDQLFIDGTFNKVVITNIIGQQVKAIDTNARKIDVSDLSKGVYVVKTYNNGIYKGTAKITKN